MSEVFEWIVTVLWFPILMWCHAPGVQAKPDVVCLGKALSGGLLPVSAVLANDEVTLALTSQMSEFAII